MSTSDKAICPKCDKLVTLHRDLDGLGRPKVTGPLKYDEHSGNRWGRHCDNSGEQEEAEDRDASCSPTGPDSDMEDA